MHGIMDACIQYTSESWQALFFNNLQIVFACIHGCMHPWMHGVNHPWMHACSVKSMLYGECPEKFLLKSAVKKVRYGLRQSGVPVEILSSRGSKPG